MEGRIKELEETLKSARIIEEKKQPALKSSIGDCIERQLKELQRLPTDQLLEQRYQRLLSYGEFKS